jgi:hypothetical protein
MGGAPIPKKKVWGTIRKKIRRQKKGNGDKLEVEAVTEVAVKPHSVHECDVVEEIEIEIEIETEIETAIEIEIEIEIVAIATGIEVRSADLCEVRNEIEPAISSEPMPWREEKRQ